MRIPDHREEADAGLYEALLGTRRTMLQHLYHRLYQQGFDRSGGESRELAWRDIGISRDADMGIVYLLCPASTIVDLHDQLRGQVYET